MRNLIFVSILALIVSFSYTKMSFAVCMLEGTTADGGNIINCPAPIQNTPLNPGSDPETTDQADEINIPAGGGINVDNTNAIQSTIGDDIITTRGDLKSVDRNTIFTSDGDDIVIVNGGNVTSLNSSNAIFTASDNDTVIINGGSVTGADRAIFTSSGDDVVTVNGGIIRSTNDSLIFTSSGNDAVNLNGGTYIKGPEAPFAVELHDDDDVLTFGGDIDLGGIVDCGEGFDTLIFAMNVAEESLNFFSSQIAQAPLPDGSLTINGVFYEWENCELLVSELNGVREVRPIPTLSEWGLIAMAGILGIAGLLGFRNRVWNKQAK